MEYHEAANFLFDLRRFRPKPGTDSTRDLLAHLGDPHEEIVFVQVAGSNGKGSTSRMTEAILRESGKTVGLYTSPHFDDIRERIRIDGRVIPKSAITTFVEHIRGHVTHRAATGDAPTFFEVLTALALWYFGTKNVDIAVLEVGIGGRYDATSVVEPEASAVTSVTLEHTEILGETIAEIARDKAHVAPAANPLVTGATATALDAIREQLGAFQAANYEVNGVERERTSDVLTVGLDDSDVEVRYDGRTNHAEAEIAIDGTDWSVTTPIPLLGAYQAINAGIAASLARQVVDLTPTDIALGLRKAYWPGRFEVMQRNPLVILDGAHNPGACEQLTSVLAEYDYETLTIVVAAMHEKDHQGMAAALPLPDHLFACRLPLDRTADPTVLANVFERAGAENIEILSTVSAGLDRALDTVGTDDCVLVTGSLYAVSEARTRWARAMIPKRIRTSEDARDALRGGNVASAEIPSTAGSAVHRVIKTRLQHHQIAKIDEVFRTLGGTIVRSGLDKTVEERLDVFLMGTIDQYETLVDALDESTSGLAEVTMALRDTLSIDSEPIANGYPWENKTAVMGILNVTPDSFHDGGRYESIDDAIEHVDAMIDAGADIIDIGGESTRPGGEPVPDADEIDRVIPIIERIADRDTMISIDTRKATVARAALNAGADMINDVSGLEDPDMRFVAAENTVPIVVMHSIDTPVIPDRRIDYDDVVEDVIADLTERVILAEKAGLDRSQIVVDPGIGFGKSPAECFALLGRADEFHAIGCPVMVGHSHKSMFDLIGCGPSDRFAATVAGSAIAAEHDVSIVRVHDVAANVAAIRAVEAARERDK